MNNKVLKEAILSFGSLTVVNLRHIPSDEQIKETTSTLTPREKRVLELRFGLDDGQTHSLTEVAKEFHVTRERIRQIQGKALRKLRHPSRLQKLGFKYS